MTDGVWNGARYDASFPLTPALSLEEREKLYRASIFRGLLEFIQQGFLPNGKISPRQCRENRVR